MKTADKLRLLGAALAGLLTGLIGLHMIVSNWETIKRWFS